MQLSRLHHVSYENIKKTISPFRHEIYDNVGELSILVTLELELGWQENEGTSMREKKGARGKTRTEKVQARS